MSKEKVISNLGLEMRLSDIEAQLKSILGKLGQINDEVNQIRDINKEMKEIQSTMEFFNKHFEDWKVENEEHRKESEAIRREIKKQQEINVQIEKEVKQISRENQKLHQKLHEKQIEIVGIPKQKDECLGKVIEKLFQVINAKDEYSGIEDISQKEVKEQKTNIITIAFKTLRHKNEILKKAKENRVNAEDLKLGNRKTKIYVNEVLSAQTKYLLYRSKALKEELRWKFVWIKEGRIMMRKKEGDRIVYIETEKDLQKVKNEERKGKSESKDEQVIV